MELIISSKDKKNDIDITLLHDKEKEELLLFYQYLLYKSKKILEYKPKNKQEAKLPETFYFPIQVEKHYKFDRDEIYSNR